MNADELREAWSEALLAIVREHAPIIFLILLALVFIQSLRLAWNRGRAARRVGQHNRLGKSGEHRARKLLVQAGFRLVAEQTNGSYEIIVDGVALRVHLRADFLVMQNKRTYVAEVKSGQESCKVTGRATRRQLLEYLYAFEVHGVLLVDMHAQEIRRIEFPLQRALAS